MKNLALILLLLVGAACSQQNLSPTETAKIVVESFYSKDNQKLKEYTTVESYESFLAIQDIMTANTSGKSNFKVLQEKVDGDIAWVQFSTSFEEKPETFKLVKENGQWKVTEKDLKEKDHFEIKD
ncbi:MULTISPECIES: DUF4878 domain-containing protein [Aequorivita]|uniref:DUF4878 domain-containing protein n=1 Tax=Aequorivita iocasae TaxID=2803865 RepID=A0ABX7DS90_9FLAO|nr:MULTISPECIES: DUF4878 domain-containing protein [Aequorivita]QQX76486.1 DUF4878 domain-containing protein [Aequorivita iocasae]UCA55958.1 DUF4878 domain-containing protein [Aequorivita sp. F7]